MAPQHRPKGDFVIEIGDARGGDGQYFKLENKEDYEVAMAAKERMRGNIESQVAAQIQGTTHRRELSDGAEAAMIRRETERRMAGNVIPDYQTALRQEIHDRLQKEHRAQEMEAANQRGIERGNLKVATPKSETIER